MTELRKICRGRYNSTHSGNRGLSRAETMAKVIEVLQRGSQTNLSLHRAIPEASHTMISKTVSQLRREGKVESIMNGGRMLHQWRWGA